jgi:hypothetical protein
VTNEEAKVLGQRAVACEGWRWMPGMMANPVGIHFREEWRVTMADGFGMGGVQDDDAYPKMWGLREDDLMDPAEWLPDFRDPATLGCLLALVRERLKAPGIHVRCMLPYAPDMSGKTPPPWVVHEGRGARLTQRHSTEAEALVSALEAGA